MGRKGVEDFYRVLSEAAPRAHAQLPPEQAIAPASPDTCEHCGAKGAVAIRFGHVFSPLAYAQEVDYTAVVCKKHATSIGLKELAWTGLGGWWGLGVLVAPKYIFQTVNALIRHSNLNPAVCVLLGLLALTPLAILIPLFVDAILQSQGHPGRQ